MRQSENHASTVRCVYLTILAVYTILREVAPAQGFVGSKLLTYGIFGLGILVLVYSVLAQRDFLAVFNMPLMLLFLGVMLLTSLVHYRYGFIENIKAFCWMFLFFILVYPSGISIRKNCNKELVPLFSSVIITMALLNLLSVPMYFFHVDYSYWNENIIGAVANQGFSKEFMRLWGVFIDANTGSVYNIVAVLMSVYLIAKHKNIWLRITLCLAICCSLMYIVLSGSRTAFLALAVAGIWVGLCRGFKNRNFGKVGIVLKCVLSVSAAVLCVLVAILALRTVLPKLRQAASPSVYTLRQVHGWYNTLYSQSGYTITDNYIFSEHDQSAKPGKPVPGTTKQPVPKHTRTAESPFGPSGEPADDESLVRGDLNNKDFTNGRASIWLDALGIFSHSPLIGASPRGVTAFGRDYCPDNAILQYGYAAHNFVLEILMGTGILGFLLIAILLLRSLLRIFEALRMKKFSWERTICGAIAAELVFSSLFLSDLFFVLTFGGMVFWFCLGYLGKTPVPEQNDEEGHTCKHILVYGLKDPTGGVERIVFDYASHIMHSHKDISFDFVTFGNAFSMEKDIDKAGGRVLYVPSRKKHLLSYKKAIKRIFCNTAYDAVWGNFSGLTNIDILKMAKEYQVPVRAAHSHTSKLYWGSTGMKYVVYLLHYYNKWFRLCSCTTDYWACSEVAGAFLYPRSVQSEVKVIPNAVDTEIFHPDTMKGLKKRQEFGLDESDFVVGHVARLCEVKNQLFLLRVVQSLREMNPKAKLLLVGDGELRSVIEEEISMLGLAECVVLTGARTDVQELLQAMDVFVLTSFAEGLSVSAVEAQASGIPCVLPTTVSPQTDISGQVSFVSLDDNPSVWAQQILRTAQFDISAVLEKIRENGYDIVISSEQLYRKFVLSQDHENDMAYSQLLGG